MAHALAGPLQKPGRIVQRRPIKEAQVRMGREGVDIGESGIAHADGRMVVMEKLAHVLAAAAQRLEPRLDHAPHRVAGGEPGIDGRRTPDSARQSKEVFHPSS